MAILVADIGGTHARFAIADPDESNDVSLSNIIEYPVKKFPTIGSCLSAYQSSCGNEFPDKAVFAVAAPTGSDEVIFTNNNWRFRGSEIKKAFGFESFECINDFVAAAHYVANYDTSKLQPLFNPKVVDNAAEVTTVVGPGTGMGVSYITKTRSGYLVRETEASHVGFSPVDDFEMELHTRLKDKFGRVSAERLSCGAGLGEIYRQLIGQEDAHVSDAEMWRHCLLGEGALATEALRKYCNCLGSIVGDLVLAQGASRLVMVGSLAGRLCNILPRTDFLERFEGKGRFSDMLKNVPLYYLGDEHPGLKGAALSTVTAQI